MESHISSLRDSLALAVENTAAWRAEKAEEYPEDRRNARSAAALRDLAAGVSELPDDSPSLRRLWDLQQRLEGEPALAEAENLVLGRYGFDAPEPTPDAEAFVAQYADELERELGAPAGDA